MSFLPFIVCIPAAGVGSRMQTAKPKQYLPLLNLPIIIHTLRIFDSMPECEHIIIASDDADRLRRIIYKHPLKSTPHIVEGGGTRQQSVMNCLDAIEGNPITLIHDAARPCVTHAEIRSVVHAVAEKGAALLALPARDTMKHADPSGKIIETLDRTKIFLAQTPQGAYASVFRSAYQGALKSGISLTDDVQALERGGIPVYVVEGKSTNIKITTEDELMLAEVILQRRLDE